MENMHLDEMEFKDIEVDDNSVSPNKKMRMTTEEDEFIENPPIVSTVEDMFYYLEYHQDELRLVMEVLRRSTLEFTEYQKDLINKMEGEFVAWDISNETRDTDTFEGYVIELKEDLGEQPTINPEFCEEQKLKYAYVYRILEKSLFPYSDTQKSLLEDIKHVMGVATGNLKNHYDGVILDEFHEFLNSMKSKDHLNSSKFYVETTVDYYVQEIVDELYYAEYEETVRNIPDYFSSEPMVNLATYVKRELQSAYKSTRFESHIDLFHVGLTDVYYRLIDIFKFTGLLTDHQKELLNGTFGEIGMVERRRTIIKYEDLHLGFYGFMDSLRRDHQERETKVVDGYKRTNEDGRIAKKVQKIVKDLIELEDAERKHHESFPEYSSNIPEITNKMFRHFRRIYPENFAEPVTIVLPNGYYRSIVLNSP